VAVTNGGSSTIRIVATALVFGTSHDVKGPCHAGQRGTSEKVKGGDGVKSSRQTFSFGNLYLTFDQLLIVKFIFLVRINLVLMKVLG
jgi:hypothetical protein